MGGFNKFFKDGTGGLRGGANNATKAFESNERKTGASSVWAGSIPVAFWDMEEGGSGTTVTDRSSAGNNLDLTLVTNNGGVAPAWDTSGATGGPVRGTYSLKLETGGENQGYIADNSKLDFAADAAFSISMWVQKDNQSDGNTSTYIAKMASSSPYRGYEVGCETGAKIKFFLVDTYLSKALGVRTSVSHMSNNDDWHHIVVTYDGSGEDNGVTIYHDGTGKTLDSAENALEIIITDTLDTEDTTVNTDIFTMGSRVSSQYTDVYMDDVAIFDIELTAAMVTDLYNSGASVDIADGIPKS